jgi:hypothetical protein
VPRFVVLEHDHPYLHWDFLMEVGDHLRGWRLAEPPRAGACILAVAVADHRLTYLDYEGPVSAGRGTVQRWDTGTFDSDAVGEDHVHIIVAGSRIEGAVILERVDQTGWSATFTDKRAER